MTAARDLFSLDGQVALVTGGGRGLGYFAAEGLAEAGADVAICGRDPQVLEAAQAKLATTGRRCIAFECDVTDEAQVIAAAARMKDEYGRCDILLNNAGIGGIVPTDQMTLEAWNAMLATNLSGMFLCCREFGKLMIEQGSGNIINFSSENGQVGFGFGMAAYATSKIGAVGLTRSLAVEWGKHGIRVNAILPGNMEEGMMEFLKDPDGPMYQAMGPQMLRLIPLGRFGSGDDIKGAVVYLASQAGAYLSGVKLVVDGGFTINSGM